MIFLVLIGNPRPFGATGKEYVYEKGSVFVVEENREIEFKSLLKVHTDSLPWKIIEKAKKFICACLNNDRRGIIYFGVGDSQEQGSRYKNGEVVGLMLLTSKMISIKPSNASWMTTLKAMQDRSRKAVSLFTSFL